MSYGAMLAHKCTIQRPDNQDATDGYNHPLQVGWNVINENIRCRYTPKLSNIRGLGGIVGEGDRVNFREHVKQISILLLPDGVDVTEQDRVIDIRSENDSVFAAGPFNIVFVRRPVSSSRSHHTSVILEEIR